ncbi:hypothetical protein BTHE68_40160 [Burkholderia sp. THE68]|uniref:transcriptional regulator fis family protein n=1 Tax=Burkholderia sp. THE68 TaxID=758782 RepID=UPI001316C71A|nr:transcriptional regulator fis family protein [Burkholderia sp. THE68]BBU30282.1 hypothetical protein BTHE68_40160 [Burkholderia sp. THE68]
MILQVRLGFETVRNGRGAHRDVLMLAQTILLTSLLTRSGFGNLELAFIRQVESELMELLERGKETGNWFVAEPLLLDLSLIVNEHDRQLREVRFGAVFDATERLDRLVSACPQKLSLRYARES